MKKLLSILLAALMTVSAATVVSAGEPFSDILDPNYSWAYPSIISMADKGYITGYLDETFRPDNEVTRLEVLALFSRALGAKDSVNAPLVQMAVSEYEEVISEYNLGWGVEEIAFLMYRGVLTENDLITYLSGELKDQPMPRFEAAIIITKAMGGESAATSEEFTVDFSDVHKIPANALGYVAYVNDKGIMTGMDGGNFSPMTSVLRSQMAVMLERTCNATDYSYETVRLISVDTSGRLVSYRGEDGVTQTAGYSKNVVMSVLGEPVTPKQMTVGVDAVLTKSGRNIVFVDTLGDVPDVEVSGKFLSRQTSDNVTSITIQNFETGEKETYDCAESVSVTYNNSPASMTAFKPNDQVRLILVGGKITAVIGGSKVETISNAVIEDITIEPDFTMTISHALEEYNGRVLEISTEASVKKNGKETDFSEIYPGDTVTLTLEYGVIQAVSAKSLSTTSIDGVIESITISSRPSINVKVRGEVKSYYVTNDVKITINNESATLYDFRVGDSVKIVLEGEAVSKITAASAQASNGEIKGVVTSINLSYGFIKISYESEDGYPVEETIYCKDATTKVMTSMGVAKKMANIKKGQTVTATGTTSNGAFTAKLIVISEAE